MHNKTKQKTTSFSHSYKLPYRKKQKSAPREIRTNLLYGTRTAPNPLHHGGRCCQTATYIRHSISNNLISSIYTAKTGENYHMLRPLNFRVKKIRQYVPVKCQLFMPMFYLEMYIPLSCQLYLTMLCTIFMPVLSLDLYVPL